MSFADSFWTYDYHLGHEVLFDVLFEGVKENEDFIQLFNRRMDLELQYGLLLENLPGQVRPTSKRHTDDDYVSTIKNAFSKMNENFSRQGKYHIEVAQNIQGMVLDPFLKWCKEHELRVAFSEATIAEKFKAYKSKKTALEKLQKKYFNKCRVLEEFRSRYTDEELAEIPQEDTSFDNSADNENISETENELNENTYTFAGAVYDYKNARKLLSDIISNIELTSHKVPILGTYHNVSSGSAITQWLLDNMPEYKGNIAKAESFGQDLIENNFIRLIGSMNASKSFINSSQFLYQWKPLAFEFTKLYERDGSRANVAEPTTVLTKTNQFTNYFEDVKQAIGVASVDFNDKSQYPKLVKQVESLDIAYFESTKDLDMTRCKFEETVMDHLAFMQKCELDRLRAVKKVMFDFLSIFSNKWAALKGVSDELFVVEETIHPLSDLKFLIENYGTGRFEPRVTLYDNYYNSNIKQTFGVDLNVKARLERKAVPSIIQATLSFLDNAYPDLENDTERMNLWTEPVHLSKVHELRFKLNELTDAAEMKDILKKSEPKVVTNVLKLYFMELPDSIVPHSYFDLIMTLYQNYPAESQDKNVNKSRLTGLQNTLLELPVCSLATLDAILTHLNRLVNIISSANEDLGSSLRLRLCKEFGALVLRPKRDNEGAEGKNLHSNTVAVEIIQQEFVTDLFAHKDNIFGELRRRNSNKPLRASSAASGTGPRNSDNQPRVSDSTTASNGSDAAKLRLETKLKRAVTKAAGKNNLSSKGDNVSGPGSSSKTSSSKSPPTTPVKSKSDLLSKSSGTGLKRSSSPNKKKLSSLIEKQSKSTGASTLSQTSNDVENETHDSILHENDMPDVARLTMESLTPKKGDEGASSESSDLPPVPPKKSSSTKEVIVVD